MRTLSEIKVELKLAEDSIQKLENEIKEFQEKCPHPEQFVEMETYDIEDDCLGPGIYEYTVVTYTCSLCEGKFSGNYNRKNNHSFSDNPPPKLEDLI